jgi:hypothetical protein
MPAMKNTGPVRADICLSYILLFGAVVFGLAFVSDTILTYLT